MVKSGKNFTRFDFYIVNTQKSVLKTLIGTYECKADAKGRIMLPAALKKQLSPTMQNGFVLKRAVFQSCLELYPMEEWETLMQRVNKLNRFNKKHNDFIRRFTAGVKFIELDASSRLLVPKDLVGFAGISKDIVMSTSISIVEIWDKENYEESIDDTAGGFADLAEEVMGQDNADGLS